MHLGRQPAQLVLGLRQLAAFGAEPDLFFYGVMLQLLETRLSCDQGVWQLIRPYVLEAEVALQTPEDLATETATDAKKCGAASSNRPSLRSRAARRPPSWRRRG